MAGIRTSINLIDNMSRILDRITGKNLKMRDSVERTQRTMNQRTSFAREMSLAEQRLEVTGAQYAHQARMVRRLQEQYQRSVQLRGRDADKTEQLKGQLLRAQMAEIRLAEATERAGKALEKQELAGKNLGKGIESAKRKQMQFNGELDRGANAANNLVSKIKGFVGVYLGFQGMRKGFDLVVGGAAKLEQQLITISGMLGDKGIGRAFSNRLRQYANISVYGFEEFNAITRQFIQFTKNTDKLMGLNKTAERLAFLDPTQGLEGAGFALKEALGGDYMSLRSRFGFGKADIGILKASRSMDEFIAKFNDLLSSKGATDKALEEFNQSAIAQMNNLKSNISTAFAMSGEEALNNMKPALTMLNQWFASDNARVYFSILGAGIAWVMSGILGLGNVAGDTFNFIQSNAEGLLPVIFGIAGGLMSWRAVQWGVAVATRAHATAMNIHRIATSNATLAQKAFNLALAMNPITTVITAILGLIVAIIAFGDSSRSVRQTFSDAFGGIVTIAQNATNAVINSINWMIRQLNKVSDFFGGKQIQEIQYRADFSGLKSAGQDLIENVTMDSLMAKYSLDPTTEAINNLTGQEALWNARQQDTLGSIDDSTKSLKKTEEDLKWLRDVAEQEVVNRFTTATLAPQISIEFGDVKETADVDGIINRLEYILTEQLNSTAEGVHA